MSAALTVASHLIDYFPNAIDNIHICIILRFPLTYRLTILRKSLEFAEGRSFRYAPRREIDPSELSRDVTYAVKQDGHVGKLRIINFSAHAVGRDWIASVSQALLQ